MILFASRTTRGFKQSKQALIESASMISVIVGALTSRIEQSESAVNKVQTELDAIKTRSAGLEWEHATWRSSHLQLLQSLQEVLNTDKRLVGELEQLKARLTPIHSKTPRVENAPTRSRLGGLVEDGDILAAVTPTERETLEILRVEGPKAAPELGKRLSRSREHTSRLMKKLYLEGYVDRESNRAPFRYKLNDRVRSALQPTSDELKAEPSEKI